MAVAKHGKNNDDTLKRRAALQRGLVSRVPLSCPADFPRAPHEIHRRRFDKPKLIVDRSQPSSLRQCLKENSNGS